MKLEKPILQHYMYDEIMAFRHQAQMAVVVPAVLPPFPYVGPLPAGAPATSAAAALPPARTAAGSGTPFPAPASVFSRDTPGSGPRGYTHQRSGSGPSKTLPAHPGAPVAAAAAAMTAAVTAQRVLVGATSTGRRCECDGASTVHGVVELLVIVTLWSVCAEIGRSQREVWGEVSTTRPLAGRAARDTRERLNRKLWIPPGKTLLLVAPRVRST